MSNEKPNLPTWTCHKTVHAALIVGVRSTDYNAGAILILDPSPGAGKPLVPLRMGEAIPDTFSRVHVDVSSAYMSKHNPKVGGYYIRYEDGYESWSPAHAFESGYVRAK